MIMELLSGLALLLLLGLSWQQYAAAVALTAALLPSYLLRVTVAGIPSTWLELAIVGLFISGLAQSAVRSSWRTAWRQLPQPVKWLSAVFVAAAVLGTIISPHLATSLGILKGWIIGPLVFGWLVWTVSRDPQLRLRIMRNLMYSAVAVSLVGLSQLGTLDRVRSMYDVPNSLALFVTPLFVAAVWYGVVAQRTFLWLAFPMGLAVLATQSAGGVAAVILTLLFGLAWWRPIPAPRLWAAVVILVIASLAILTISGRTTYLLHPVIDSAVYNSVSVRLQLWSVSAQLIRQHPVLGIGLGTFEPAYQRVLHERFAAYAAGETSVKPIPEFVFRDPHNWLLSFWLNTGALGLFSFVGLNLYVLWTGRNAQDAATQAVQLALMCLLVFGLVDTIYWKNDLAALHLMLWSIRKLK